MRKVEKEFLIGRTEEETFTYIGLAIKTTKQGITLDQIDYSKERLAPTDLRSGDVKRPLDKEEIQLLRRLTGQINWTATQSRPDISYMVVELSSKIKNAQMEDLKTANSAIIKLAATPTKMMFPKIEGKLKIVIHSETAFRTLPDQVSSGGGHLVFLTSEKEQEAAILGWTSNKVKKVVGSILAAEALSLQEAVSHAIYLRGILAEVLEKEEKEIPMVSYVSSNNLYQAVHSNKFVEDKKMRLDIVQVRRSQEIKRGDIKKEDVE